MSDPIEEFVKHCTGASKLRSVTPVQSLWSGYGQILRQSLEYAPGSASNAAADAPVTIILKTINPQSKSEDRGDHPRGWNTEISHQRKLQSYRVESHWYREWSGRCDEHSRIARSYGVTSFPADDSQTDSSCDRQLIVLEDLDEIFPQRRSQLSLTEARVCLQWLANFHALHMGAEPDGLWQEGTYWHLATRQDEFDTMQAGPLKSAAVDLDAALKNCRFQSIVHGDAKVANFCFSDDMQSVAAVDFQYVGGGCGMKDLVYFLGSCLDEEICRNQEHSILDTYFAKLVEAIERYHPAIDALAVEVEWRSLYAIAWTDFYRFLQGWMPEHSKINGYTEELAERALLQL